MLSKKCVRDDCKEDAIATGKLKISNPDEWNNRISSLVDTINLHIQTIPEKDLSTHHLFYS